MTSNDLYFQILGLTPPWRVSNVELDMARSEVRVYVDHDPSSGRLRCSTCGRECPGYDTQDERMWRHLDTMQLMTYLVCSLPRVECPVDGVRPAKAPWAEPGSHFTLLFERFAIAVLEAVKVQKQAASILRLSPNAMHRVMHRAVARGLRRRPTDHVIRSLTIDEKAIANGHSYATVLGDGDRDCVLDVVQDRTLAAAKSLLETSLTPAQRQWVRCVTMDMWKPFATAVKKVLPHADIVHDRFHIAGYLGKAVDDTRKAEHARLAKEGASPLAKSKYLWLRNPENLKPEQKALFLALMTGDLETSKVWAMKEAFKDFFQCSKIKKAQAFFDNWYERALAIGSKPLTKVAAMLKSHLPGLLAYITHRTSNARAESINSKIQALKTSARGYRKFENFRIAILFFFGRLQLYPQIP